MSIHYELPTYLITYLIIIVNYCLRVFRYDCISYLQCIPNSIMNRVVKLYHTLFKGRKLVF